MYAPPANTYEWNAENQLATIVQNGSTFETNTYNALGFQVEADYPAYNNAKVIALFDPSGRELGHYNGKGNAWWDEDVWGAGRMLAQEESSDTYFLHANVLGSDTQVTGHTGSPLLDILYYPWGGIWQKAGSEADSHFAGFEQGGGDIYQTPARSYLNTLGLWMSPDPMGGDVTNPQSLNRYAYALNNPATLTDPLGLQSGGRCSQQIEGWEFYNQFCGPFAPGWGGFGILDMATNPNFPGCPYGDCSPSERGVYAFNVFALWSPGGVYDTPGTLGVAATGWQTQNPCTEPILNAGNNQFGTEITANNVLGNPFPYSKYGPADTRTVNLNISAGSEISMVSPGRFPVHARSYIIGIGPTLHVPNKPGELDSQLTLKFGQNNDYTEHLDNSYFTWWNPITWATHGAIDVVGIGRNPCPH